MATAFSHTFSQVLVFFPPFQETFCRSFLSKFLLQDMEMAKKKATILYVAPETAKLSQPQKRPLAFKVAFKLSTAS